MDMVVLMKLLDVLPIEEKETVTKTDYTIPLLIVVIAVAVLCGFIFPERKERVNKNESAV